MKAIGIGVGLPFRRIGGIDPEAQTHFDRVIADGGVFDVTLQELSDSFKAVKQIYGVNSINDAFWACKPHVEYAGYLQAAGVGATAGNRACRKIYDWCGASADYEQATAAAQPLLLRHTGQNYVWLPGVANNNFTTPNAAANQITGDIDIRFHINYSNNSASQFLVSKTETAVTNHGYDFFINSTNFLFYQQTRAGVFNAATSSVSIGANYVGWIRMTRVSSTGVVTFFTSSDGVNWVQLGTTVTLFTGALDNPNAPVNVGSYFNVNSVFRGEIYRATISNTIGGAPVVDFNPSNYNRLTSQTTWTSTTGEVWTLNTPNTNNALKAAIVDQTMIMGNGTNYGMRAASLNIIDTAITNYGLFRKFVNTAGGQIFNELGSNTSIAQGTNLLINANASEENIAINANVGFNNSRFTSNSLNLKIAAGIVNIDNANEALPYEINNVAQTFVTKDSSSNNTAAMNATGLNFLARNNAASLWANLIAVGHSVAKGENTPAQRTAIYNLLRQYCNI